MKIYGLRRTMAPMIPMPAAAGRRIFLKKRWSGSGNMPPQQVTAMTKVGRSIPDHLDVTIAQQFGKDGSQYFAATGRIPDRPRKSYLKPVLIGAGVAAVVYLLLKG